MGSIADRAKAQAASPSALAASGIQWAQQPALAPLGLDALPAGTFNPSAAPKPEEPSGFGGFFTNLFRSAEGIVTGLSALVGSAVHDTGKAFKEAVTLGKADDSAWQLAEIGRQIPKIPGYYADYYGPLVGYKGTPADFLGNVYKDPLQPILDVLGASNMAGKAAARASRGAAVAGTEAPQWTKWVLGPSAGTEYAAGFRTSLMGQQAVKIPYPVSPVKRGFAKAAEKIMTQPLSAVERRIGILDADPYKGPEQARLIAQLERAKELGIERLDKLPVADFKLRRAADYLFAQHGAHMVEHRERIMRKFAATFKDLNGDELSSAHLNYVGIDVLPAPFKRMVEPWIKRYYDKKGKLHVEGKPDPGMDAMAEQYIDAEQTDVLRQRMVTEEELPDLLKDVGGKPIRVYHGTAAVFDQFDPDKIRSGLEGFYFSDDPRVASSYAQAADFEQGGPPFNVRMAYLKMKNPFYVDGFDLDYPDVVAKMEPVAREIVRELDRKYPSSWTKPAGAITQYEDRLDGLLRRWRHKTAGSNSEFYDDLLDTFEDQMLAGKALQAAGFDGLKYDGGMKNPLMDEAGKPIRHNAYVVFDSDQVKTPWEPPTMVGGKPALDKGVKFRGRSTREFRRLTTSRGFIPDDPKNFPLRTKPLSYWLDRDVTPDDQWAIYSSRVSYENAGTEPWKHSADSFVAYHRGPSVMHKTAHEIEFQGLDEAGLRAAHRASVEAAVAAGKKVPFWALADTDLPGSQRGRFLRELTRAMDEVPDTDPRFGFAEDHFNFAQFLFDKSADSAVRLRPDRYKHTDDFYREMYADYQDVEGVTPLTDLFDNRGMTVTFGKGDKARVSSKVNLTSDKAKEHYAYLKNHAKMFQREIEVLQPAHVKAMAPWKMADTDRILRRIANEAADEGVPVDANYLRARVGDARAAVMFGPGAGKTLRLMRTADLGTIVHEQGHIIRRILPKADLDVVENYYRVSKHKWDTRAEEAFAQDLHRYLTEDFAPAGMRPLFAQIKETLKALYRVFRPYLDEVEPIPAEVRKVFDSWFGPTKADAGIENRIFRAGYDSMAEARKELARVSRKKGSWTEIARARRLDPFERADILADLQPSPMRSVDYLRQRLDPNLPDPVPGDAAYTRPPFAKTLHGRAFGVDVGGPDRPPTARPGPARVLPPDEAQKAATEAAEVLKGIFHAQGVFDARLAGDRFMGNSEASSVVDVEITDWNMAATERAKLQALGEVVAVHNFASGPHELGYRGINVDVLRPDGSVVQVRLHTPWSRRASLAAEPAIAQLDGYMTEAEEINKILKAGKYPNSPKPLSKKAKAQLKERLRFIDEQTQAGYPFIQQIFEPVVHELTEQIGHGRAGKVSMSNLDRSREEARLLTMEELTNPMFGGGARAGTLTLKSAFERQYLHLRMAAGATWDAKERTFVGGKMDPLDIHYQRQAAGMHTPIYFPLQDPGKLTFSDFLMKKSLVGARKSSKGRFLRPATGSSIESGRYVTNPTEVFQRRAAQAIRMAETFDTVRDAIERFGRRFDPELGFSPEEEVLFAPDGLVRFFAGKVAMDDWVGHALAGAADADEAVAAALKKLMPLMQDQVKEFLGVTKKGLEVYAMPRVVAEQLMAQVAPNFTRGKFARNFWNPATDGWKTLVLAGSPRWVVNNFIGNTVFLKLMGAPSSNMLRQVRFFDERFRKMIAESNMPDEVKAGFMRTSEQWHTRTGSARARPSSVLGSVIRRTQEAAVEGRVGRAVAATGRGTMRLNAAIEDAARTSAYLKAALDVADETGMTQRSLMKRMANRFWTSKEDFQTISKVGLDPAAARKAIDRMNYWMNDYARLSPKVRHIVKPYIFPFWTFYRHVGKLILTMPIEHPERFNMLKQLSAIGKELTAGYGPLPEFLEGAIALGPGDEEGKVRFLSTSGPNPFNAVFASPMQLLHPLLKVALEQATGRTALSGFRKPFTSPDVITPYGSSQQYRVNEDGTMDAIDRNAPGIMEHLLGQVPQYQIAEQIVGGGAQYGTTGIWDAATGRGTISNPDDPTSPLFASDPGQQLGKLFGFSTIDYNVQGFQDRRQQEAIAAFLQYLRQLGIMPPAEQRETEGLFG